MSKQCGKRNKFFSKLFRRESTKCLLSLICISAKVKSWHPEKICVSIKNKSVLAIKEREYLEVCCPESSYRLLCFSHAPDLEWSFLTFGSQQHHSKCIPSTTEILACFSPIEKCLNYMKKLTEQQSLTCNFTEESLSRKTWYTTPVSICQPALESKKMTETTLLLYAGTQLGSVGSQHPDERGGVFFQDTLLMIEGREFKRVTLQIIGPD